MDKIGATTPELYLWMRTHMQEIEYLVLQRERLAIRVVRAYTEFFRSSGAGQRARAERTYRKVMNAYIARDLTITERAKLRELYGAHADDPEQLYTGSAS